MKTSKGNPIYSARITRPFGAVLARRVNTCVSFPYIQITIQPIRSSFLTTLLYNL